MRFFFALPRSLLSETYLILQELDLLAQSYDLLFKSSICFDKQLILLDRDSKFFLFSFDFCLKLFICLFQQIVLQPHFWNLILNAVNLIDHFSLLLLKHSQPGRKLLDLSFFLLDTADELCSIFMSLIEAEPNLTQSPNRVGQFLFRLHFLHYCLLFGYFQFILGLSCPLSFSKELFLKAFFLSLGCFNIFKVGLLCFYPVQSSLFHFCYFDN